MKSFAYKILENNPHYLVIKDLCRPGDISLTNAAEEVVASLAETLKGRRLFYVDSINNLDEIKIKKGAFDGFAPGGPNGERDYA